MGLLFSIMLSASAVLYTLAAVAHLLLMSGRDWEFTARWSTRVGFGAQTLSLALLIAETGRFPIHSLFEFAYFFTWVIMSNFLVIEIVRRNQAPGSFLMPVIALVTIATMILPKPTAYNALVQEFPAALIGWHVGVILMGYVFFMASFVTSALYLWQDRALRLKRLGSFYHRIPSLEILDIWSGRFVSIGFPLLTMGMVSGLIFAQVTWDTFWQADPKVIFTVIVWLVYAGYLLLRKVVGWGGRRAAWWSVAGVITVLVNYFIVNLLSTLHRFGV